MNLSYTSENLKELTEDLLSVYQSKNLMQRKIGHESSVILRKRLLQIKAAPNFNEYLNTGLGKPHILSENLKGWYGVSILANTRLILKPDSESLSAEELKKSISALLRGVLDYHGRNENWLVS